MSLLTYNQSFAITLGDTSAADLTNDQRTALVAIIATGSGNIVVVRGNDTTETIPVVAGTIYPFRGIKRINSTNTTATGIKGLVAV